MTTHREILSIAAFTAAGPALSLAGWIKSIGGRIAAWADTCARPLRRSGHVRAAVDAVRRRVGSAGAVARKSGARCARCIRPQFQTL